MHEVASKHSPMAPLWAPDPVFENACSTRCNPRDFTRLHVQLQYLCLRFNLPHFLPSIYKSVIVLLHFDSTK